MNPRLEQAVQELESQVGALELYSDYGDWAEVGSGDGEYTIVLDPQLYAAERVADSIEDYAERLFPDVVDTLRNNYMDSLNLADQKQMEDTVYRMGYDELVSSLDLETVLGGYELVRHHAAQRLADMSAEAALALVGQHDAQRLPGGAWWWEEY